MVNTEQGKKERKEKNKGGGTNSVKAGTKEVLEVEEGIWEGRIRENASAKALGSCHRAQGRICTKKREGVLTFQGQEGGSAGVCKGSVEEGLHLAVQVTPNIASALCSKERWKEKNGPGLLTHQRGNDQEHYHAGQ